MRGREKHSGIDPVDRVIEPFTGGGSTVGLRRRAWETLAQFLRWDWQQEGTDERLAIQDVLR
jgi:hypothetical protein